MVAYDEETHRLVNKVEEDTRHAMMLEALREERREEVQRKEELRRRIDHDGDVEMGETERGEREKDRIRHEVSKDRDEAEEIREIFERLQALEGEVVSWRWKKVDEDNSLEARIDILEGRLAAIETYRPEEPVPRNRRRMDREVTGRPLTRGGTLRLEGRVDEMSREFQSLRHQIREVEKVQDEAMVSRKRIMETERRIVGIEGKALEEKRKVVALSEKLDETRQRHDLLAREISQSRSALNSGLLPRVAKSDNQVANLHYRLVTVEQQVIWTDQKLRALWAFGAAKTPVEALKQAATLRALWSAATNALTTRLKDGPAPADFSKIVVSSNKPVASGHDSEDESSTSAAKDPSKPTINPARY